MTTTNYTKSVLGVALASVLACAAVTAWGGEWTAIATSTSVHSGSGPHVGHAICYHYDSSDEAVECVRQLCRDQGIPCTSPISQSSNTCAAYVVPDSLIIRGYGTSTISFEDTPEAALTDAFSRCHEETSGYCLLRVMRCSGTAYRNLCYSEARYNVGQPYSDDGRPSYGETVKWLEDAFESIGPGEKLSWDPAIVSRAKIAISGSSVTITKTGYVPRKEHREFVPLAEEQSVSVAPPSFTEDGMFHSNIQDSVTVRGEWVTKKTGGFDVHYRLEFDIRDLYVKAREPASGRRHNARNNAYIELKCYRDGRNTYSPCISNIRSNDNHVYQRPAWFVGLGQGLGRAARQNAAEVANKLNHLRALVCHGEDR